MNSILSNFFLIFICVLCFSLTVFLIAFIILELIMQGKENERYVEEKSIKDLIKKFHKKLDTVSNQRTNEILECLKEMEELDSVYYVIVDNDYSFMSEERFIDIKSKILDDIISDKISDIEKSHDKKEKYKSLYDELNVCQKRYPLYKNIYNKYNKNSSEKK